VISSASENDEIRLGDPASGKHRLIMRGEAGMLRCLAFTPDGEAIAAAAKGQVLDICDVANGREIPGLKSHKAAMHARTFSHDGSVLASCSHDGAVGI
jgi:WD40 repeat protein